jgi:tRNA dimethylallyltransferase
MNSSNPTKPLVVILGPTASGKTALGVWIAERFCGEVVACDSTQLYKGFDIGTAKPTMQERRGIQHHLVDSLESEQEASAGSYRELALAALEDLRAREKLPVFTVGTGLYLRALLEGLAELPQRSEELREQLRDEAAEHGRGHLHRMLESLDPAAAKRIAPGDQQKLIRAIEVCLLARKPLTELHRGGKKPLEGWNILKIGLEPARKKLYDRIEARTDKMLASGWMEEVQGLLANGQGTRTKPFDFIGYAELRRVHEGQMTMEEARAAIQQATRRYAKRQITWFRREANVHRLDGFGDDTSTQSAALDWLCKQGLGASRGHTAPGVY